MRNRQRRQKKEMQNYELTQRKHSKDHKKRYGKIIKSDILGNLFKCRFLVIYLFSFFFFLFLSALDFLLSYINRLLLFPWFFSKRPFGLTPHRTDRRRHFSLCLLRTYLVFKERFIKTKTSTQFAITQTPTKQKKKSSVPYFNFFLQKEKKEVEKRNSSE